MLCCAVVTPAQARDAGPHPAVIADPKPDAAHPAGMSAFVIPSGDGAINAVMYTAAGAGLHPTLLLLHGFPGNEQNLDIAQAARRANMISCFYDPALTDSYPDETDWHLADFEQFTEMLATA